MYRAMSTLKREVFATLYRREALRLCLSSVGHKMPNLRAETRVTKRSTVGQSGLTMVKYRDWPSGNLVVQSATKCRAL